MKRIALAAAILAISACAKAEEKPMAADSPAAAAPAGGMDTMKMADTMKMMDTTKADTKGKSKM